MQARCFDLFILALFSISVLSGALLSAQVGAINTIAGSGSPQFSGDGGQAAGASFFFPRGLAIDGSGNLLIADVRNHRIRKIDTTGTITTVAGNGTAGCAGGDGDQATAVNLSLPQDLAVDSAGNFYVPDSFTDGSVYWDRVRKVSTSGVITTVAGKDFEGSRGFSGDGGPATLAQLDHPSSVAVDPGGNLYIADTVNHRVRRVGADGIITTVAGNGTAGYSGDDGPATLAMLNQPTRVRLDSGGNLYIADSWNHRIRKVTLGGTIVTVAGSGNPMFDPTNGNQTGDGGQAIQARVSIPSAIFVDGPGNLYMTAYNDHRVRRVDVQTGIISTVAGTGDYGFSGDGGPATQATLNGPNGLVLDPAGNLLIADALNHRLRSVQNTFYLVGDCALWKSDLDNDGDTYDVGEFGDGYLDNSLNVIDLIYALRAVTQVPGYTAPACSDRFDAMDSFPTDTADSRGGDHVLNTLDLITTLRRVTSVNTSRPRRQSRFLPCSGAAAAPGPSVAQGPSAGDLQLDAGQRAGTNAVRVPVYLAARRDLTLLGFAFGLGLQGRGLPLSFVQATGQAPTLVDTGLPGKLTVGWLKPFTVTAGQRLLLGYVEISGLRVEDRDSISVQVYAAVANDQEHTRTNLPITVPSVVQVW